jgi:hypothetical protein
VVLHRLMLVTAAFVSMAPAALAQSGEAQPPPQNCQATPPTNGNSGNNGQSGKVDASHTGSTSAAGKLDTCDGVLRPPPTGDRAMTRPPPSTGEMPVIKPGQLPPQQSTPQQQ